MPIGWYDVNLSELTYIPPEIIWELLQEENLRLNFIISLFYNPKNIWEVLQSGLEIFWTQILGF